MHTMFFVKLLLTGSLFLSTGVVWAQSLFLTPRARAEFVYGCLFTGHCDTERMLVGGIHEEVIYEAILKAPNGRDITYTVPLDRRQLEIQVIAGPIELVFVDEDLDGFVDHFYETSTRTNTAIIYSKEHMIPYMRAQHMYTETLEMAIKTFGLIPNLNARQP